MSARTLVLVLELVLKECLKLELTSAAAVTTEAVDEWEAAAAAAGRESEAKPWA